MINLRHGRDGALAAAARIALLDAHGRRNAGDEVNVRPGELLDKLPRIDVHRIQKAALPFRKQQVERERAFARTADPGDDNEFVAWNFKREVFEVVLACAVNGNGGWRMEVGSWSRSAVQRQMFSILWLPSSIFSVLRQDALQKPARVARPASRHTGRFLQSV